MRADQFANVIDLNVLRARQIRKLHGAMVVGDQVIDHTRIRLRGGNSRYAGTGKRHFRFKFPKGTPLHASDEQGNPYPRTVGGNAFQQNVRQQGLLRLGHHLRSRRAALALARAFRCPRAHWVQFRVVQNAAEAATPTTGDFWGLYQALELPDGKNFLKARNLPLGNF